MKVLECNFVLFYVFGFDCSSISLLSVIWSGVELLMLSVKIGLYFFTLWIKMIENHRETNQKRSNIVIMKTFKYFCTKDCFCSVAHDDRSLNLPLRSNETKITGNFYKDLISECVNSEIG